MNTKPSFFKTACEEPFRIFFPPGLLVGIGGVMLWPLYFAGVHQFYPGTMHARLMIEGCLGAFVFGFLGTAGPRLTDTAHFSATELRWFLGLWVAVIASHIAERYWLGDTMFLVLLGSFVFRMGSRFLSSTELPPPGFALVGLGFVNGIVGTAMLVTSELGYLNARLAMLGSTMLNEIFVLFLVLGVGSFLLPRFLQVPIKSPLGESRSIPPSWKARAKLALLAGAVMTGLFGADVFLDYPRATALGRFAVATAYLLSQVPLHRSKAPRVTITRCLHLSTVLTVAGLLFPAIWPMQRVAGLHIIFIGGFALITFTVATRVVLGHGGFGHLFFKPLPFLFGTTLLLLSSMVLRIGGDFAAGIRGGTLSLASYLWMAGAALWAWRVLPKVRMTDTES